MSAKINCAILWICALGYWAYGFAESGIIPASDRPLVLFCCLLASTAGALLARPIMSRVDVP